MMVTLAVLGALLLAVAAVSAPCVETAPARNNVAGDWGKVR